jgi:hypothetical protein
MTDPTSMAEPERERPIERERAIPVVRDDDRRDGATRGDRSTSPSAPARESSPDRATRESRALATAALASLAASALATPMPWVGHGE